MTDSESSELLVGRDIPWEDLEGQYMRVNDFNFLAKVELGKIKEDRFPKPYGFISVECPKLPCQAIMPIFHKLDFKNLWEVFRQRKLSPSEEVLVAYAPIRHGLLKPLSRTLPNLVIRIYPKGRLEQVYNPNSPAEIFGKKPIAEWDARPKGHFLY